MSKRIKQVDNPDSVQTECETTMACTNASVQSRSDNLSPFQSTSSPTSISYHLSVSGSILHPTPSKNPSDIFTYIRHGNFDAFRRSFDIYHAEIVRMKNEHGQTVLHVLVIHAYDYVWVRLVMMRGCDMCAQDNDGYTPAHYAVERDDVEMLRALTVRIHSQVKPIPESQIVSMHERCLRALSIPQKQGMTVFMLACLHESVKCIQYLLELNINDVAKTDVCGDTCLHYAVARRNRALIEKLLVDCGADVNGGHPTRPSVLDILQFNREQQKPFERVKDNAIEQDLLLRGAQNRFSIRRVTNKRKGSVDSDESLVANLAGLSLDSSINARAETGRRHARIAAGLHAKGDLNGAQQSYTHAIDCVSDDTLDWAVYAFQIAILHTVRGEYQSAIDLMRRALHVRKTLDKESETIEQIQRTIDSVEKQMSANAT